VIVGAKGACLRTEPSGEALIAEEFARAVTTMKRKPNIITARNLGLVLLSALPKGFRESDGEKDYERKKK